MTSKRFVILEEHKDEEKCITDTVCDGKRISFMDLLDVAEDMEHENQTLKFEYNMEVIKNRNLKKKNEDLKTLNNRINDNLFKFSKFLVAHGYTEEMVQEWLKKEGIE